MKKFNLCLVLALLISTISLFAVEPGPIKYFNGVGWASHIPTCYAIECPRCKELAMVGKAEPTIAERKGKQYVKDEAGNKYIEYICKHGHYIWICYDGPDFKGNK